MDFEQLAARLAGMEGQLARLESRIEDLLGLAEREHWPAREREHRDVLLLLDRIRPWIPHEQVGIVTDHPVAMASDDHLFPRGTAVDNTRYPRFVAACERLRQGPLTALDIGCAGGGLVLDFILRGHRAYGVEGSDYSRKAQRAEWRLLGDNLFTADATRPFRLCSPGGEPVLCDVVCAWEVMEHIPEAELEGLFANVAAHLVPAFVEA
jgi:2-polyprenyl-3-methyl-5-hydroxy-6-metoxy-1,4-benzoquinol methylase